MLLYFHMLLFVTGPCLGLSRSGMGDDQGDLVSAKREMFRSDVSMITYIVCFKARLTTFFTTVGNFFVEERTDSDND